MNELDEYLKETRERERDVSSWYPEKRTIVTGLIALASGLGGFGVNSLIQQAILEDRFERHAARYGHSQVTEDVGEMAKAITQINTQIGAMVERQRETNEAIKSLTVEQREDMRDVRKALRLGP